MKSKFRFALFACALSLTSGVFAQDIKKSTPESKQPSSKSKTPKKGDNSKIPAKKKAVKAAPAKSVYKSK